MIAVWFSCGAASAAALKLTVEKYGAAEVRAVNNPVKEEDADNLRFMRDVAEWVGVEVETAKYSYYPSGSAREVWAQRRYMSGNAGAPCTMLLKKGARYEWEAVNKPDWHVLGFTSEEKKRHERFVLTERENVLPVLIDAGMTKADCADMIRSAGLKLPRVYDLGFPNANCIGCVKSKGVSYWNLVRKTHPEVFADRAKQSRELGVRLVQHKGRRIFLDELPADAKGRKLVSLPDCGVFCEERSGVFG